MRFFAFSALFALAFVARAETMPFTTVSPYDKSDEKKIIVLMKYDCPYCRGYHAALDHWAQSLPPGYQMEFLPVLEYGPDNVATKSTMTPFVIYHGLENAGATAAQLMAFSSAAYAIEQDSHTVNDRNAWLLAGAATGLPGSTIANGIQSAESGFLGETQRLAFYAPKATPTIIVCGKYEFTPDNVSGVPSLFIQLLNATLSKCMIDQGVAPK